MSLNEILQPLPKVWANASFNSINIDSGGIITGGNINVANSSPNVTITNNANPINTNRATLQLIGSTSSSGPLNIQQNQVGDGIIENFAANHDISVFTRGSGGINLLPMNSGNVLINPNSGSVTLSTSTGNVNMSVGAGNVKITGANYPVGPCTLGLDASNNVVESGILTSFTPSLNFGGAHVGMTFTTQQGSYMRFGKLILFQVTLQLSNKGTSTGAATLNNFPFSSSSTNPPFNTFAIQDYTNITLTGTMSGVFSPGNPSSGLIDVRTTGTFTMNDTNFANNSFITTNGWYFTN